MNSVFELEVNSFWELVKNFAVFHDLGQRANCSTEQPRSSRSYFYSNCFVAREQQLNPRQKQITDVTDVCLKKTLSNKDTVVVAC